MTQLTANFAVRAWLVQHGLFTCRAAEDPVPTRAILGPLYWQVMHGLPAGLGLHCLDQLRSLHDEDEEDDKGDLLRALSNGLCGPHPWIPQGMRLVLLLPALESTGRNPPGCLRGRG
jgi:hypothetical protein